MNIEHDIINKLNEISISIAEIKKELQLKNEHCKIESERISKLEKLIYGNGSPGIRIQVYILWAIFLIIGGILIK